MLNKPKVIIIDDHEVFCESLALLLSMKGIEVLGTINEGKMALEKLQHLKPDIADIVLMDIEMKDIDGIQLTKKIKNKFLNIEIIMLTMHCNEEYIVDAFKAGAKAYVLKDSPSFFLLRAIEAVSKGESFVDPKSTYKLMGGIDNRNKKLDEILTPREKEIVKFIYEGYTNKEISKKLNLSTHTIRNHIVNIFQKLNCSTRTKAVKEAQKRNLI